MLNEANSEEAKHHHLIDKIALINALVSGVSLYPQIFILYHATTTPSGFSPFSFELILLNNVVWLLYGLHRKNAPLAVSSVLNVLATVIILFLI